MPAYVAPVASAVERAPRELKAFASVEIAAGTTAEVVLTVRRDDLAYWDIRVDRFVVEGGAYRVEVGASSRDLRGSATVDVAGDAPVLPLTPQSTLAAVFAHPVAGPKVAGVFAAIQEQLGDEGGVCLLYTSRCV